MVEMVVEVVDHLYLLLDYFGEDSIFDCEQSSDSGHGLIIDFGLNAHPQGHSSHYFQYDASETPDVDDPWIFILLHLLEHLLVVVELVLEEDVVEYFRRHVLGSGHGELLEVGEEEAAAEVDEFDPADEADVPRVVLPLGPQQDVLCFEVGVHDVVAVDQEERLAHLHHQDLQLVLVLHHPGYQLLVHDLHPPSLTR
jgi:hypothetical protein